MILPTMILASFGFSSRKSVSASRHDLFDHRPHFGGHQLVFGLRRELRIRQLDGQDASQAFPHVVAGGLHFRSLGELVLLDVLIQRARHRRAQRREMRAAVALRNVVGEAQHRFLVRIVPLHGDFHADAIALAQRVEDVRMQDGLGAVDELDECANAAGELEDLFLAVALVDQLDAHAIVQERELAQALGQDVVVELDVAEHLQRSA